MYTETQRVMSVELFQYLRRIHGDLITAADEVFRQNGHTFDEAWRCLQTAVDAVHGAICYLDMKGGSVPVEIDPDILHTPIE